MKPIIIDIGEVSESVEAYESKPNKFIYWFIYILLGILGIALLWMTLFKIDIVVKGTGTIITKEDVSTVTNIVAGNVIENNLIDGQNVVKGDVLYIVDHNSLDLELSNYMNQESDVSKRLEILSAYEKWLSDRDDSIELLIENPYYQEFVSRKSIVELNLLSLENEQKQTETSYGVKIESNENLANYYSNEIEQLKKLINAVKTRTNPFNASEGFYYSRANDYIFGYNNTANTYNGTIQTLQNEIAQAQNIIAQKDAEIQTLTTTIADARSVIDTAGGDESLVTQKQDEITNVQGQINTLETEKSAQQQIVDSKTAELNSTNATKATTLQNLENEMITSLETSVLTYQQNLIVYEQNKNEYSKSQNLSETMGTQVSSENIVQTELESIAVEIKSYETKQEELKLTIQNLQSEIEKATVIAPISGVVNIKTEFAVGDFVPAGTSIMQILPSDESAGFLVKSYISNQDIAKIQKDMNAKYEIAAYPSSEYGAMTGTVDFISVDLKVSDEAGGAYYQIESTIEDGLKDSTGEKVDLKVGMLCETKIIVEQKSVLRYLLEKIKLVD